MNGRCVPERAFDNLTARLIDNKLTARDVKTLLLIISNVSHQDPADSLPAEYLSKLLRGEQS